MMNNFVFPFTAVEGQEDVKKALLWNVVNPSIGGVLISGQKGTAKSTLVRGLAALIPGMKVVELPLNVTEDRLVGTIDIERAIKEGRKAFEPGIFHTAHENILYIDEVNLLPDNIVNCILEVSASGVNRIEREGISYCHPSKFVLVGTMNPEEGMLRPHFLDRFGLYVEVNGIKDPDVRASIIKKRLEYEADPAGYLKRWKDKNLKIAKALLSAIKLVKEVEVPQNLVRLAGEIASKGNCAGHRAEITIIETSRAIAALSGRKYVIVEDIKEAARFALPHRVKEKQQISIPLKESQALIETSFDESEKGGEENSPKHHNQWEENFYPELSELDYDEREEREISEPELRDENKVRDNSGSTFSHNFDDPGKKEKVEEPEGVFDIIPIGVDDVLRRKYGGTGKRSQVLTDTIRGRYIKSRLPKDRVRDIAYDATIRAAAPFQRQRKKEEVALVIHKSDIRVKVRERRIGNTILFIVDASGSMGANQRMKAVKGAILSLLNDVYQKRDKVGMICFRKNDAKLLLGVTRSVDLAQKMLRELPTGGKTPLAAGLYKGFEFINFLMLKDPQTLPFIILVSDGRANVAFRGYDPVEDALDVARKIAASGIRGLVIDTEKGFPKMGLARKIAEAMKADYVELDELEESKITSKVKEFISKKGRLI